MLDKKREYFFIVDEFLLADHAVSVKFEGFWQFLMLANNLPIK